MKRLAKILGVAIFGLAMALNVQAAGKLYFPHVAATGDWETEIGVVNASSTQSLEGVIKAYDNNGAIVANEPAISLAANGRRQMIISDEYTNSDEISYMVFEITTGSAIGYTKFWIDGIYRAAVPAVDRINSGDIYIPHIASDNDWFTGLALLNTSGADITLSFEFNDGTVKTLALAAGEHNAFTIKEMFGGQLPDGIESAVIKNGDGVIGIELFGSAGANKYLGGILLKNDAASKLYWPHVADTTLWMTAVCAYNTSSLESTLTITPYREDGSALTPQTLTISGNEKYIGVLSELNLPSQTAWLAIESTRPLSGFELFADRNGDQLAGYTCMNISGKQGVFAKIEKNGGTGIAFVNVEDSAASIDLSAFDDAGNLLDEMTLSLQPHEKWVDIAQNFFTEDIGSATYIRYDSDGEVAGFQLNSSDDGLMLDALEALPAVLVSDDIGSAAVVINEVVAKAIDDGEDWIEFYVSGTESINLSDYTVVDDNEEREPAALPDVTLAPGEFYVVLASDEAPEDGSDYVPFKLGSDDCVSLFLEDDLIDELDWDDGDVLIGYSYGNYPDGSGEPQTLSPTQGYENEIAERGPLTVNEIMAKDSDGGFDWFELYNAGDTVVFLGDYQIVDDGEDQEPEDLPDVSLSPGEFLVIYATGEETDTVPYWVDFKLGKSDSLSLILNDETVDYMEWDGRDAAEGFSYGLYPDGSWDCQTLETTASAKNEPIDFFLEDTVEDIYITIDETDWESILASPLSEEYHTASITYRNITVEDVAFRTRGSSSLQAVANMNSERYSFKVDMNYYVDGQKLLGMKKINLNNNYKDPSYMRERIGYDMMRSLNLPTPRLSYVNLYINGALHGLYTLVEQVDSEFLEENFDNPDGDLYKPDGVGSDLLWYGNDFASYSGVELKTNEETSDNAAFISMVDVLNNGGDLESVINVDGVLRYLAVSTALSNLDSYQGQLAHNYYIYVEDGVFSIIPWDLNESFGTFTMGCRDRMSMISLYIDEPTSGNLADRPLIAKLLENQEYKTAYHGYIEDLIDGVMDPATMLTTIEDTKNLISDHVANDPTAFYSYAEFETSLGYSMVGDIFGLQGFVADRTDNLMGQLSGSEPSEGNGTGSCGDDRPSPRF